MYKKITLLILVIIISSCSVIKNACFSNYEKFELIKHNDMLFIELTLNGKKVLFLVDTGASKSVIDIKKSTKYGYMFLKYKEGKYIGIGGFLDFYIVYNYIIQEQFIPLVGIDMEELTTIFKRDGMDIVGIIGSDFLNSRNSFIDYENSILYYKGN